MNLAARIFARTAVVALVAVSAAFFAGCGKKNDEGDSDGKKEVAVKGEKELQAGIAAFKEKKYEDAVKNFQAAADKGNSDAMFKLAVCYGSGQGVEMDDKKCESLMKKAAEAGNVKAKISLVDAFVEWDEKTLKEFDECAAELLKLAKAGDADAQALYAFYCIRNAFNKKNFDEIDKVAEEAGSWAEKAKKNGSVISVVDDMDIDEIIEENIRELKSAAAGKGKEDIRKGLDALKAEKYEDAFKSFEKAANDGNSDALLYLSICYEAGKGVETDKEKSMELIRKSADAGNVMGKFATILNDVFEGEIEEDEAFKKMKEMEADLLKLAEANDPVAQVFYSSLSSMKAQMEETPEARAKAAEDAKKWMEKAKESEIDKLFD